MKQEIVVARGLFSKLTISLNDGVDYTLATIPKKDNPLAAVEDELKQVLAKFELTYFEMANQREEDKTND